MFPPRETKGGNSRCMLKETPMGGRQAEQNYRQADGRGLRKSARNVSKTGGERAPKIERG
jgi:hypothetical protein